MATPTSYAMELGLQAEGSFRETLITEDFVVAVWPLSELVGTVAEDITGNHHDGAYVGTGYSTGVVVDLPEGHLGRTFAGAEYVEVPDDGDDDTLNMSLANGSMDVCVLFKTTTNDATLRCLVQKQETNSSGDGWHVAIQSGKIEWYLKRSGSVVFNFQRGSGLADGNWHLVQCYYRSSAARIYIDGAQAGSAVATAGTEAAYQAVDLRIGAFTNDAGFFVGSLAFVMVGREGNSTLSAALDVLRDWTAVTSDVRLSEPIRLRYGINGATIIDRVASPGSMTFLLDNSAQNSAGTVGYYSPGHASARSGFRIGIPVRFSVTYGGTTYYKFRGQITDIQPAPGIWRERYVMVTCADWFGLAAESSMSALEAQVDQRSDNVMRAVLTRTGGRSPAAVAISVGSSQFPIALDVGQGESESVLTEGARITQSEWGFWYPRGDTTQGGTVAWEGRGDRQAAVDLDATFDNTMQGLEVRQSRGHLINTVRCTFTPRRIDSASTVLYALEVSQQSQALVPGETVVWEGGYRDSAQEAVRVGGVNMITPVAGTDYALWTNSDGSGEDLTADLEVVATLGGNSWRLEMTNRGTRIGYLRVSAGSDAAFQIRGYGAYHYTPVTVVSADAASVRRHGERRLSLELPYESSRTAAQGIADFVRGVLADAQAVPATLSIIGNASTTLLTQALAREPGDKIGIVEDVTGITTDDPDSDTAVGYYINQVAFEFAAGSIVSATWTLAPTAPTGAGVFDESAFDEDLIFGI